MIIKNRKAYYDYEVIKTFTAGVMLEGYEVKPIKSGNCTIGEAHCYFKGEELFIKNITISESVGGEINREKKLLLNRKELTELSNKVTQKGLTISHLSCSLVGHWLR